MRREQQFANTGNAPSFHLTKLREAHRVRREYQKYDKLHSANLLLQSPAKFLTHHLLCLTWGSSQPLQTCIQVRRKEEALLRCLGRLV